MIVTWSGKLFTLRVSRYDFDRHDADLNQPQVVFVPLVIVGGGQTLVGVIERGIHPGAGLLVLVMS